MMERRKPDLRGKEQIVRKKIFAIVAMLLMGATFMPAQKAAREPKDAIHMNGSVSKMAGDTMTVAVADQSADVKLLPTTTYKVGAKAATVADLHVGDSVDVVVVRKNPDWLAQSVKITHAKK